MRLHKERDRLLRVIEDPVNQGQLAPDLALIDFCGGKVMARSERLGHIVRAPYEHDMNDSQTGESAEDGGHGQVVSQEKFPRLYSLPQQTDSHDGNSDPAKHPDDDKSDFGLVKHVGNVFNIEAASKATIFDGCYSHPSLPFSCW